MLKPYYHGITVAKLRELLAPLDGEMMLVPNEVKNLAVGGENPDGSCYFAGYIDFGQETLEIQVKVRFFLERIGIIDKPELWG